MADLGTLMTQRYGPLAAWQWGLVTAGVGYLVLRKSKSGKPTDAQGQSGQQSTPGEFQSSQSQTSMDDKGNTTTSQYSATGPLSGFGGGVGLPMGYPMPYSGGDVYVNLPGDQQNLNSGRPAHYPPKSGPGVSAGHAGGFWWTPLTRADTLNISAKPYGDDFYKLSKDAQDAARIAMNYSRIVDANPQIDWAGIRDINDVIGRPIYIPQGSTGDDKTVGYMPAGASLNAPQGYSPPTQQTSVNGTS